MNTMDIITVNKTLIVQGTLTFVAAIACSDALREITSVMKRDTVLENAILKTVIACVVILMIFIIAKINHHDEHADDFDVEPANVLVEHVADEPFAVVKTITGAKNTGAKSTLPDEAVMETYANRDYSEYMSTFI